LTALDYAIAHSENFQKELLYWFFDKTHRASLLMKIYPHISDQLITIFKTEEELPLIYAMGYEDHKSRNSKWEALAKSADPANRKLALTIILGNPEEFQLEIRDSFITLYYGSGKQHYYYHYLYQLYQQILPENILYEQFKANQGDPVVFDEKNNFEKLKDIYEEDLVLFCAILIGLGSTSSKPQFRAFMQYRKLAGKNLMSSRQTIEGLGLNW
jgi:hypothetical protein